MLINYGTMHLVRESDGTGWTPGFPPGVGFQQLAGTRESDWGLYRFDAFEPDGMWRPAEAVGDRLERLIESGERFPPALASARNAVKRGFPSGVPPRDALLGVYAAELEACLARQATSRAGLGKVPPDQSGGLKSRYSSGPFTSFNRLVATWL